MVEKILAAVDMIKSLARQSEASKTRADKCYQSGPISCISFEGEQGKITAELRNHPLVEKISFTPTDGVKPSVFNIVQKREPRVMAKMRLTQAVRDALQDVGYRFRTRKKDGATIHYLEFHARDTGTIITTKHAGFELIKSIEAHEWNDRHLLETLFRALQK